MSKVSGDEKPGATMDQTGRFGQSDLRGVVAQIPARNAPPRMAAVREPLEEDYEDPDQPAVIPPAPTPRPETAGATHPMLPPIPMAHGGGAWKILLSLFLMVAVPTILSGTYFAFFAAPQYVAEFRFSVTSVSSVPTTAANPGSSSTGSSALGGVMAMLGGSVSSASMQNYVVIDYLLSRQAVDELEKRIGLRQRFSTGTSPADWWASFPTNKPTERFLEYWNSIVSANYDPTSGLAVVKVRAFRPEDARAIADGMVMLAEDLVNRLEKRVQDDAVHFAENEVTRAEQRLKTIRADLAEFRNKEGVIDPTSAVATNVDLAKTLRATVLQLQTDLAALGNQQIATNAPAAQLLRSRISATQDQLAKVEREVAKDREGARALSGVVARFEQLDLDRQYAAAMLVSTRQALDQARASAASQALYLTPYVKPALPESADFPKGGQTTFIVFFASLLLWVTGVMLVRSIKEHLGV